MKNSSYIADSVFKVKWNYEKLQNLTEELFFKCLENGEDVEYFTEQIDKIWGNIDHTYMDNEISQYQEIIHERNIKGKEDLMQPINEVNGVIEEATPLFLLVPLSVIIKTEKKFQKEKIREYKKSFESPAYQNDKDKYIPMKLKKYTNQTVPYYVYDKYTGELKNIRYVPPSVYNSMIYNTNLTRSGWNTTFEDAEKLGINKFIIPYHSFSCPHCIAHQERIMDAREVVSLTGNAEEASGDILHPNCKCELTMYEPGMEFKKSYLTNEEKDEIYQIRQKVNGLTLEKERIKTKMNIADNGGYTSEYDKYNQQRNKINKQIRELKEALPTTELKKQVVAINR